MLDNKTKERIAADAKKAARTAWEKLPVAAPMICIDPIQKEIQAVLEAEATRAAGLVEGLNKAKSIAAELLNGDPNPMEAAEKIVEIEIATTKALTNYNNPVNK